MLLPPIRPRPVLPTPMHLPPNRPRPWRPTVVDRRPRPRSAPPKDADPVREERDDGIRLQKALAAAGVGSRRHCEELIEKRRVRVNGTVVREQGVRVDPETDVIEVDGV